MISFTDHYNAISLNRLPFKTKIGKDSCNFNNSLLCKPEFSSATNNLLFLLKPLKKIILQQITSVNAPIFGFKRMLRHFPKIP